MEVFKTAAGRYVLYNRHTDEMKFDNLMGPGPWYWGREDGTGGFMVYRRGYETREEALNVMKDYSYARMNDCAWPY